MSNIQDIHALEERIFDIVQDYVVNNKVKIIDEYGNIQAD